VVTLADDSGTVLEHRSYDPFGKPRQGDFIDAGTIQAAIAGDPHPEFTLYPLTDRGFTDHEHLDEQRIIHMNGRAYDYDIGRFTSVDPFIQAPGFSQSINPYSYIMNNPLSGVDPSGYESHPPKEETDVGTGTRIKGGRFGIKSSKGNGKSGGPAGPGYTVVSESNGVYLSVPNSQLGEASATGAVGAANGPLMVNNSPGNGGPTQSDSQVSETTLLDPKRSKELEEYWVDGALIDEKSVLVGNAEFELFRTIVDGPNQVWVNEGKPFVITELEEVARLPFPPQVEKDL